MTSSSRQVLRRTWVDFVYYIFKGPKVTVSRATAFGNSFLPYKFIFISYENRPLILLNSNITERVNPEHLRLLLYWDFTLAPSNVSIFITMLTAPHLNFSLPSLLYFNQIGWGIHYKDVVNNDCVQWDRNTQLSVAKKHKKKSTPLDCSLGWFVPAWHGVKCQTFHPWVQIYTLSLTFPVVYWKVESKQHPNLAQNITFHLIEVNSYFQVLIFSISNSDCLSYYILIHFQRKTGSCNSTSDHCWSDKRKKWKWNQDSEVSQDEQRRLTQYFCEGMKQNE